jgi:dihydrofolate reductase
MRKIVAFENVTLDGVMQGPGHPDEDRRGGFEHGGWAAPYADEEGMKAAAAGMGATDAVLLGRVTYSQFATVWPNQPDNPFGAFLNKTRKYVASRTLEEPLPWANSVLLNGDALDALKRIREEPGKNITILGSGELLRSLLKAGLVDDLVLQIHPLVLGSGRRLFGDGDDGTLAKFSLSDERTTSTGVVVATYSR